jgi:misacylated tRNA(Ala) deacylase
MTKLLYMDTIEGNYIKQFDAKVIKTKEDYIVLNTTAFYPEGGGQPSDTGIIEWDKTTSPITNVTKKGIIKHHIDGKIPQTGTEIQASLNWPIRYAHMKMHTAQHIISGIVFDTFNARTVGNQIHADYSRVDFKPASFSDDQLKNIETQCNTIISKNLPIKIYTEERTALEKRVNQERCNLDLLPRSITSLRIVEIQNFDICPCAGTHVRKTGEIPPIIILKKESKGKDTTRIIYKLSSM